MHGWPNLIIVFINLQNSKYENFDPLTHLSDLNAYFVFSSKERPLYH